MMELEIVIIDLYNILCLNNNTNNIPIINNLKYSLTNIIQHYPIIMKQRLQQHTNLYQLSQSLYTIVANTTGTHVTSNDEVVTQYCNKCMLEHVDNIIYDSSSSSSMMKRDDSTSRIPPNLASLYAWYSQPSQQQHQSIHNKSMLYDISNSNKTSSLLSIVNTNNNDIVINTNILEILLCNTNIMTSCSYHMNILTFMLFVCNVDDI